MLFEQYLERLVRRGRTEKTRSNFIQAVAALEVYLIAKGLTPETIDSVGMEEFFFSLPYAISTKRLYLTQIRSAYHYAMRRGVIDHDPTYDVDLPSLVHKTPRILTSEDLRGMRELCYTERQWALFHLYAYTGCRRNEIRTLMWDDVSLPNNTITVMGKGAKERLIPIHPVVSEVLATLGPRPGKAVIPNPYGRPLSMRIYFDTLRDLHPTATFHDFRRTVASSLDANGVEEVVIMKIMGWAPKTIFDKHYRHVAGDRLQHGILQLYRNDPI